MKAVRARTEIATEKGTEIVTLLPQLTLAWSVVVGPWLAAGCLPWPSIAPCCLAALFACQVRVHQVHIEYRGGRLVPSAKEAWPLSLV